MATNEKDVVYNGSVRFYTDEVFFEGGMSTPTVAGLTTGGTIAITGPVTITGGLTTDTQHSTSPIIAHAYTKNNTTATTNSGSSYVVVAGTFTLGSESSSLFSLSSNSLITYTGTSSIKALIAYYMTVNGSNDHILNFQIYHNGTNVLASLQSTTGILVSSVSYPSNVAGMCIQTLATNDTIQLYGIDQTSNSTAFTALQVNVFIMVL